jgi:toxin FitB
VTWLLDTNAISDLMRSAPRIEDWIAGLHSGDRVITCTIVRGEVLFGIALLPQGRRRQELEEAWPPVFGRLSLRTDSGTGRRLLRRR